MKLEENLWTLAVDLTSEYMGRAVELYFDSVTLEEKRAKPKPWDWVLAKRSALSSMVHANCGLESVVNAIAYDMFFNPDSDIYVAGEKRDIPLKRMVESWNGRMQTVDRLQFILSHRTKADLPPLLAEEIRELNNLRNWIVHGFSFKRTILVEPKDGEESVFTEVDMEDTVKWEEKSPRLKFNPMDRLDAEDARKVLSVVLRTLKTLCTTLENRMFTISAYFAYFGSPRYFIINAAGENIDKILDVNLELGSNNKLEPIVAKRAEGSA